MLILSFSVQLPEELLAVAGTLRTLDLSDNRLRVLPPSIAQFKNLKSLNLSGNRLSELPEELTQCSKLESIQVNNNNLTSLPPSISTLKNLKSVSLAHNQFDSLPSCLCHIGKLEFLDMSSNKIATLPEEIGEISVVEVNLNGNRISILPPSLAGAKRLKVLRVEENVLSLDGIPKELLAESSVSLLCADGNTFTGRELSDHPGYDEYIKRYAASRKKAS
jgi:Leucine-rich repeat (LRR) protein